MQIVPCYLDNKMTSSHRLFSPVNKHHGFTLIELLVVIVIIGLLAGIGIASFNGAIARGRDAKRKSDLAEIQLALKQYYFEHNTYRVANAGHSSHEGEGWITANTTTEPNYYADSIIEVLKAEGYLEVNVVADPTLGITGGHIIVLCEGDQVYALFTQLEEPTVNDEAKADRACGVAVSASWDPVTTYNKNYVVTNKLY